MKDYEKLLGTKINWTCKIASPSSFCRQGKTILICLETVAKTVHAVVKTERVEDKYFSSWPNTR